MVNDIVDATEMVNSFNYVVYIHSRIRYAYCVCFEDISRLVVRQLLPSIWLTDIYSMFQGYRQVFISFFAS